MLTFGVGIAIMAVVFSAYASKSDQTRVTQSVDAINRLIDVADRAYANRVGYDQLNASNVLEPVTLSRLREAAKELPDAIPERSDGSTANPWNGVWEVGSDSTDGATADLLTVRMDQVPTAACIQLVGLLAPTLYDTQVNGELVGLEPARTAESLGRSQTRPGMLSARCAQDSNDLTFRYLKPVDYTFLRGQPLTSTLTSAESAAITPSYTRIEAAMVAREAAQVALP